MPTRRSEPKVFLLVALLGAYGLIHTSLPRFLAQIYGSTAVGSYDLSWPIGVIAVLLSQQVSYNDADVVTMCMTTTAAAWWLFFRFGRLYFRYDTIILRKILHACASLFGRFSSARPQVDLESYIPIIAVSLVRIFFELPVMISMGLAINSICRSRSGLVTSSISLLFGIITRNLDIQHYVPGATVFCAAIMLSSCSSASIPRDRTFAFRVGLLSITTWCLFTTTTLSCGVLPGLLRCSKTVGNFNVLSAVESRTGRIAVVENSKYRLLVADHSLLGGEWVGVGPNQSVFLTFYMQAMALYSIPKKQEAISILQIGLGIGTATKTILDQPVFIDGRIDVVEIDPHVLKIAHNFFELPRPENDSRIKTYAVDALDFLKIANNSSYDLISHDIFTGGSLTFDLFTKQFFEGLSNKLTTGGVLTVNYVYAPEIAQNSFEAVISTLQSVFLHVTVYVESGKLNSISNIVIFASNRPIFLDIPDSGHEPITNLGKTAREMKHWEFRDLVKSQYDTSQVLHDQTLDGGLSRRRISKTDHLMAMHHWHFMRNLLPEPENELWYAY